MTTCSANQEQNRTPPSLVHGQDFVVVDQLVRFETLRLESLSRGLADVPRLDRVSMSHAEQITADLPRVAVYGRPEAVESIGIDSAPTAGGGRGFDPRLPLRSQPVLTGTTARMYGFHSRGLAQDLAAAWELARPERRKQLVAALFETVKVGGGRIVSVKPKAAVMPLVVVTMTGAEGKDWRSRPDSNRRSRP